jgi:hypothetical protein
MVAPGLTVTDLQFGLMLTSTPIVRVNQQKPNLIGVMISLPLLLTSVLY